MPAKKSSSSARKKFMVMRTKQSIYGLLDTPDVEVDEKLSELQVSLAKVFGEKDAEKIVEDAIDAVDEQQSGFVREMILKQTEKELESDG
jgi:hypothetical protein